MKTLKELFEEHGQVWLAFKDRPHTKGFKPLSYSEKMPNIIIGENALGAAEDWGSLFVDFVLYQEKPKTKKLALYAVKLKDCMPSIDTEFHFYESDEDFKESYVRRGFLDEVQWFRRLDFTEIILTKREQEKLSMEQDND